MKLTFESGPESEQDRKALKALVEKIRARFKVSASPYSSLDDAGEASLAIAALGASEEQLSQTLDAIASFCESSGFGRIESEHTLMDDIDSIAELGEEEDEEDEEDES